MSEYLARFYRNATAATKSTFAADSTMIIRIFDAATIRKVEILLSGRPVRGVNLLRQAAAVQLAGSRQSRVK
jgi:hypothetical protein